MSQSKTINRRFLLASRPHGAPTPDNFKLEQSPVPVPAAGQVLLRTVFLSLDPYMRGRMSDAPSYAPHVEIGEVMVGGTVSRVEASEHADYKAGDLVLSYSGWQDYALSDGKGLTKLDARLGKPSHALGVLGMPGFTAYMGLLDIGQPQAGETVVVAAATGAVGSVVGQIAKLKGCRVVGIAGGADKCRYAVEELGFDACIDHRGAVFNAVLPLLNLHARVPVCGLIANYNAAGKPEGPDHLPGLMGRLLVRRIKMQGFIIFDYNHRYMEFFKDMSGWVAAGKIKFREDVVDGLENAPQAFIGLLEGKNFGKLVIRAGDE